MKIIIGLKTFLMVGFCVTSCLFFSCQEDTSQLGLELQNPNERVLVFNDSSMQINSYTSERLDFIKLNPMYLLLGYQNDPTIGSFENSFMTEIQNSKPSIKGTAVVDSLIFYLSYSMLGNSGVSYPSIYGDSTNHQLINIYELNRDTSLFGIDSMPNTDDVINTFVNNDRIGLFKFTPKLSDTVLRIKLPNTLGQRLLNGAEFSDSTLDYFHENVFRGLYFKAQKISGAGAISSFTIADSTRIELHYHDDSLAHRQTEYYIYSSSLRCNTFKRTYSDSIKYIPYETVPTEEDEEDNFYIKNNNGLESLVEISGLQTWSDSGYITINKATLTLEPDFASIKDSLFEPISHIMVYQYEDLESGFNKITVPEYQNTLISYVDSVGYQLNIKRTIFSAINAGKDKVSLILSTPADVNKSAATRTVFKGANNEEKPIKLHITYTKFSEE